MQGVILIVDDISTNRIVLKVKLAAASYQVLQAATIAEAMTVIAKYNPDLVVTAISLPDGSAAQFCQKLRSLKHSALVPVLAIGTGVDMETRLDTLRAGAVDVMERPINETMLLGRVRTAIRAHLKCAEWQIRDGTEFALGLAEAPAPFQRPNAITFVGFDATPLRGWAREMQAHISARFSVAHLRDAVAALHAGPLPDAVILSLPDAAGAAEECLRLIPALRASAQIRDIALLVIQATPDPARATAALDVGADDVMTEGFNATEAGLRLQTLLQRKRLIAQMLDSVRTGLREVIHDPLTGLYNRRYITPYMTRLNEHSTANQTPYAVIVADMDHFKRVNDAYGHASGDAVLVETARRIKAVLRSSDMVARMGGEEFLIVLPATNIAIAHDTATRLCDAIGDTPFIIPGAEAAIPITISLGLTFVTPPCQKEHRSLECVSAVIDRADKALYDAKMQGRNRVTLSRPRARPAA